MKEYTIVVRHAPRKNYQGADVEIKETIKVENDGELRLEIERISTLAYEQSLKAVGKHV